MQRRYDRYGLRTRDIEAARRYVEGALGVEMSQRDSGYWGSTTAPTGKAAAAR